jgi:hypothetical protein
MKFSWSTVNSESRHSISADARSPSRNVWKIKWFDKKPPGREADHSSPSSAEVKNAWSYTSTPAIRFNGVGTQLREAQE